MPVDMGDDPCCRHGRKGITAAARLRCSLAQHGRRPCPLPRLRRLPCPSPASRLPAGTSRPLPAAAPLAPQAPGGMRVLVDPPMAQVLPLWSFPLCSALCSATASVATHPIDVVKTRLQVGGAAVAALSASRLRAGTVCARGMPPRSCSRAATL